MKIISHRGNLSGKDPERENQPKSIQQLLINGIDVEVDVWWKNKNWYLGHDYPQHKVTKKFLLQRRLWCHAKNQQGLIRMLEEKSIHCFWHQNDDYTITSKGYVWAYPGKIGDRLTIVVALQKRSQVSKKAYGICTDYPIWWKSRLP